VDGFLAYSNNSFLPPANDAFEHGTAAMQANNEKAITITDNSSVDKDRYFDGATIIFIF
jgi:hypothetical protein